MEAIEGDAKQMNFENMYNPSGIGVVYAVTNRY